MDGAVHYPTLRTGREHLTDVLDAAAEGRPRRCAGASARLQP